MVGDGDADDTNNGIRRSSAFTWNGCDSIAMAARISYRKQRLLPCQAIHKEREKEKRMCQRKVANLITMQFYVWFMISN